MMTYKNRCELEKAICESGNKFQYAHHGPCEGMLLFRLSLLLQGQLSMNDGISRQN